MKAFVGIFLVGLVVPIAHSQKDWPSYSYDQAGQRYSPLKQIDTGNVSKLRKAWQYGIPSEPASPGSPTPGPPPPEAVPIMVNAVEYPPTANHTIVPQDPER